MLTRTLLVVLAGQLFILDATAETLQIAPANFSVLSSQRGQLSGLAVKLMESRNRISTLIADHNNHQENLRMLDAKSKGARDVLEKKQKYDRENPGEIAEQLLQAQERNRKAMDELREEKAKIAVVEQHIIEEKRNWSRQNSQFKPLLHEFERDIESVVESQLLFRLSKLQVAKQVEAKGQVSCGEDSMRVCKERSKKEAERNAIEQGSIIDFSAVTEVKNLRLTKEELKSEVHATLTDEKVLQQKIIDESTGFSEIRVTVKPVIGEQLRKHIASDIRLEIYSLIGGSIDYQAAEAVVNMDAAQQSQRGKHPLVSVEGKKKVRIGQVTAVKPQYGYLVFLLDNESTDAIIEEVVIEKNGRQFFAEAEKRVGASMSATLSDDEIRRIENRDVVFVYQ